MQSEITRIFSNFIYIFLHPFKIHRELKERRRNLIFLQGEASQVDVKVDLLENIIAAWVFIIINAFYTIFGINISILLLSRFTSLPDQAYSIFEGSNFMGFSERVIDALSTVTFFPLICFVGYYFWFYLMKWSAELFNHNGIDKKSISQVAIAPISSNFILVIPIFGPVLKIFAYPFYLFAGMKANLGFSSTQAMIVLLGPFLLLLLSIVFFTTFFTMTLFSF